MTTAVACGRMVIGGSSNRPVLSRTDYQLPLALMLRFPARRIEGCRRDWIGHCRNPTFDGDVEISAGVLNGALAGKSDCVL